MRGSFVRPRRWGGGEDGFRAGCAGSAAPLQAVARAAAGGRAQGGDGVVGDLVERVGGVGDHDDPVGLDGQRLGADRDVDRRDAVGAQRADALDAGLRVVPAAVR